MIRAPIGAATPGEYFGDLGLRLPGQACDVPLAEPGLLEQLVRAGDVVSGQHRAHVVAVVQRGVDRRRGLLAARRHAGRDRGDLIGVPLAHPPPASLAVMGRTVARSGYRVAPAHSAQVDVAGR